MNSEYIKVLGSVSPYCKDNSNCPGYMFYDGEDKILLDCGFGISRMLKMPEDLNNLTIVISHLHKDHYTELFALAYASHCYHKLGLLDKKIDVYIPRMYDGEKGYDDYQLIINNQENYFNIIPYDKETIIDINKKMISFCENKHSIKSYSTKIETNDHTIVYTGDTGFETKEVLKNFSKDADLLICEATYLESDNAVDENHLHANEAGIIANMANVNTLMLTHFWPEHNKEEYVKEAQQFFQNTFAAEEDQIIKIDELNHFNIKR